MLRGRYLFEVAQDVPKPAISHKILRGPFEDKTLDGVKSPNITICLIEIFLKV
jgi:hypothetical protein